MNSKNRFEASYHQERLWFIDQFEKGSVYKDSPTYHNFPVILELNGTVDHEKLGRSVATLINKTPALKSTFHMDGDRLYMVPGEDVPAELGQEEAPCIDHAMEAALKFAALPFSLQQGPLIRYKHYVPKDGHSSLLVISIHSIIVDSASVEILIRQLISLYHEESPEAAVPVSFFDFARWQKNIPHNTLDNLFAYWRRRLYNRVEPLNLFNDTPRALVHVYSPGRANACIEGESYLRIKNFIHGKPYEESVFFLAAFKLLLNNYCRQDHVICGIPVANRGVKGTKRVVGPIANLLPVNTRIVQEEKFSEYAVKLSSNINSALKHQALPFEWLVQKLNPDKDMARTALFDVLFRYEAAVPEERVGDKLCIKLHDTNMGWGKYDLNLLVLDNAAHGKFQLVLCYNSAYYSEAVIQRFIAHFLVMVDNIVSSDDQPVCRYHYITDDERDTLLNKWNNRNVTYPYGTNINTLFKRSVSRFPGKTAVSYNDQSLSYEDLDMLSDGLAGKLIQLRPEGKGIVGLMSGRSLEMIVGMLAILKSGNAYLPLDPELPPERLKFIVADSKTDLMLEFTDEHAPDIGFSGKRIRINLDELSKAKYHIAEPVPSNALAYVLYTSGTTGKPKGVLIEHEQVVRLYFHEGTKFDFTEGDKWSMFFTFSFDFSVWEIWGALFFGGELVILPKETLINYDAFITLLSDKRITILNQTPTAFYQLSAAMARWPVKPALAVRKVIFGGEALVPSKLSAWRSWYPDVLLINMYGITETTVHTTYKEIWEEEIQSPVSNIGVPFPTVTTYLMDDAQKLVPVGVVGEIYVGGKGVARGYWQREDLNRRKFIDNPWVKGERVYRSGDLAKWLDNGELEFIGRIDNQVQIRGFRVELDEIRAALSKMDGVKDVFVCVRGEGEDKVIYAYVVATGRINAGQAKLELAGFLPAYMIPGVVIQVDAFTMTPNGKLDVRALPLQDNDAVENHTLPENDVEERLLNLFAQVLKLPEQRISTSKSFFDLGGHSLNSSVLINKIADQFGARLPISTVFKYPHIKALGAQIKSAASQQVDIVRRAVRDHYELSPSQRRIYILQKMDERALLYNITNVYKIRNIDVARVIDSFNKLVARHESLRTSFEIREHSPVQIINRSAEIVPDRLACKSGEVGRCVQKWVRPFDLSVAPLMRVAIVTTDQGEQFLAFDIHHIVTDGVSNAIFIRDFSAFYNNTPLPEIGLRFTDFSVWQNSSMKESSVSREFWLQKFKGEVPSINLPLDFKRPSVKGFSGDTKHFEIDQATTHALTRLCKSLGITPYTFMLSAYHIVLRKLTGQEDIVVGSPSAGRKLQGLEHTTGVFINVLAHRNYPAGNKIAADFLKEVGRNALEAFEHEDYQFETLVDDLVKVRDTSRNPLFDVMLDYHNEDNLWNEISIDGITAAGKEAVPVKSTTMFDLNLHIYENERGFKCDLNYSTQLFKPATVERMAEMFCNAVCELADHPQQRIADVEIISLRERNKVLFDFNDTHRDFDEHLLIHELFERRVNRQPAATAIICGDESISYGELNRWANKVAHALISAGLNAGDYIAITMDRSIQMIAAVLGVLKAGGTYVPIEPHLPDNRIETLISLLGIRYFAVTSGQAPRVAGILNSISGEKVLMTVATGAEIGYAAGHGMPGILVMPGSSYSDQNPETRITSADHAYVIFTSGSTGVPKGVIVRHRPVINVIQWVNRELDVTDKDKILFVTSLGFDLSVYDIFGILDAGACIRLATRDELEDPEKLLHIVLHEKITIWDSAPAAIQQLIHELETADTRGVALRLIMLSGDWIPVALPDKLREHFKDCEVVSLGGATEATIWSNYFRIREVDNAWVSIPYGKPIQNSRYYILDQYLQPCPIGVPGDLYIGGACLASGYVGDSELTDKKFVNNPFVPGEKMYLTGDTAKWFEDGNIEFLGRKDSQVKIRGHRIELGEVEGCFRKCTGFTEILAIAVSFGNTSADKQLCVYYVAGHEIEQNSIRDRMSLMLPSYMVPAFFVRLDEFPVNQSGKVDRKRLPEPKTNRERDAIAIDEVDRKILALCSETLGLSPEQIDIRDNFFELGGHSLSSTSFLNKIRGTFGIRIPLVDFFRFESLTDVAQRIRQGSVNFSGIPVATRKAHYQLSSAQKRLFILHQLDSGNIAHGFNIPLVFEISEGFERTKVCDVFRRLIQRHESLRTSFHIVDSMPVQRIHENVAFDIEDLAVMSKDDIRYCVKRFVRPFDLQEPPLLRVGIINQLGIPVAMVIDIHHIISDGVSQHVLVDEFLKLYDGAVLPSPELQYKDYAEWQFSDKYSPRVEKQKQLWMEIFSDDPQYLKLPSDFTRDTPRNYKGKTATFVISKDQTDRLYQISRESGGTLFTTLLATINILLAKLSGQNDITVGTVTSGRNREGLEKLVGLFLNTLALRNFPKPDLSIADFLGEVRKNTLEAFDNQDYPYEELVNSLKLDRNNFQNPLFNVVLILQNIDTPDFSVPGLTLKRLGYDYDISKMDITFICTEKEGELQLDIEYSTSLFKAERIGQFIEYFRKIISQLCVSTGIKIGEIEILDEPQRELILRKFNDTRTPIDRDKCYHQLFEREAMKNPGAVAAVHNGEIITYGVLNSVANRIAGYLIRHDAGPGEVVAVCFPRGIELLATIIAVLKTGASYVAIDHEYPAKRIRDIITQSEARICLVDKSLEADFLALENEVISLRHVVAAKHMSGFELILRDYADTNPEIGFSSETTAYIIYTSGTTGVPKGIMVHQLGMLNHMYALIAELNITDRDTMAQTASCSSDIFVVQLLLPLITGGTVSIVDKDDVLDPRRLFKKMNEDHISLMEIVPSLLTAFLENLGSASDHRLPYLRAMLSMGESLKPVTAQKWYELYPDIDLYNAYGPAEASDDVSLYKIEPDRIISGKQISIGYPLNNVHIYIMDEKLNLCPVGVLGEICVSGIAVGKGYWKDEEKTKASFVGNPLYPYIGDEDYKVLYRTGDLGYWQSDGSLIFESRKDHMVKIRGFRVEPGDIENAMLGIRAVKEVAVIDRQYESGTKYLCAYFVASHKLDPVQIRQHLLSVLPGYMVPAYFVQLDKLPLTASDKVDRKALPIPQLHPGVLENGVTKPVGKTEALLVPIWQSVLGVDMIGTDQGFFDFGGDSIKAINLQSAMLANGLDVDIKDVYLYATIRDLAARIDAKKAMHPEGLQQRGKKHEDESKAFSQAVSAHGGFDYKELTKEDVDSIFE